MLRPMLIEPVPHDTVRVAQAAFPKGHRDLRLADELDTLFTDEAFLALFPTHGQPAQPPWRLALVTMLQFAERLSDHASGPCHPRADHRARWLAVALRNRSRGYTALATRGSRGRHPAAGLDAKLSVGRHSAMLA